MNSIMQHKLKQLSLSFCLVFVLIDRAAFATDQPQWGEAWTRNMVSKERGLPDSFDPKTGQNIKWTGAFLNQ
jgi:hypothetical protein